MESCRSCVTDSWWHRVQQRISLRTFIRDARIGRIFDGTNEILRSFIALSGMQEQGECLKNVGKAIQSPLSEWRLLLEYTLRKIGHIITTERLSDIHPLLKGEARTFEKYSKVLHQKAEKCLTRYRKEIINQQFQLSSLRSQYNNIYS